jgi:hypothetical protein
MPAAAQSEPFLTPERLMKFGVALCFDAVKLAFSIAILIAPLIAASALGNAAKGKCEGALPSLTPAKEWVCDTTQKVVTIGVGIGGYFLEFGTGVGDFAVAAAGEVFDDAINFMAWCLFTIWFMITGVKFWGQGHATKRLLSAASAAFAGLIPFVNLAPTITIGVISVEWHSYKENREKQEKAGAQNPAQDRAARIARQRAHLAQRALAIAEVV